MYQILKMIFFKFNYDNKTEILKHNKTLMKYLLGLQDSSYVLQIYPSKQMVPEKIIL